MILSIKNFTYSIGKVKVSSPISFELKGSQTLLISGPNGIGKSTLLRALLRHDWEIPTAAIGYLPQIENTDFHLPITLGDALRLSSDAKDWRERALATGLLSQSHLELGWNTASGGERKRTLLARLLIAAPRVLVLDEPLNHLDDQSRRLVIDTLGRFVRDGERAVILVAHGGLNAGERHALSVEEIELA